MHILRQTARPHSQLEDHTHFHAASLAKLSGHCKGLETGLKPAFADPCPLVTRHALLSYSPIIRMIAKAFELVFTPGFNL